MRLIVATCCILLLAGTSAQAEDNPIGGFFKKLFSPSQPSPSPSPPPPEPSAAAANPSATNHHKAQQKQKNGGHVAAASQRDAFKPDASKPATAPDAAKPAAGDKNQAKPPEQDAEPIE